MKLRFHDDGGFLGGEGPARGEERGELRQPRGGIAHEVGIGNFEHLDAFDMAAGAPSRVICRIRWL